MVVTPWGESESLREGMLTPGPSNPPASVADSQRQRLYGAIVASVAERGYAETRVADLVEISGVSLRSFYDLFPDKEACLTGAVAALVRLTGGQPLGSQDLEDLEADSKRLLGEAATLAAAQPAAARLCLVEAFAAGRAAAAIIDEAAERLEGQVIERLAGASRWAGLPPEVGAFAIGTIFETFRSRLIAEQADRLPEAADQLALLLLLYEPPVRPLRSAARPPETRPEEQEASDHAERALRALEALLVEQTFAETTMEQVAKRAGMSVRTLYANFAGREELMLAAIDSAGAQVTASALPAYRRGASPAEGVRAAITALLGLLSSRPNLSHLLLVAAYEGGAPALRRRSEALRPLEGMLLRAAPAQLPVPRTLLSEALLGGLLWLARRRMIEAGAQALLGMAPICTYFALAPMLGAEQATEAAEGKSYRRAPVDLDRSLQIPANPHEVRLLSLLSQSPLSVEELAEVASLSRAQAEAGIAALEEAGVVEQVPWTETGGPPIYQSRWPVWATAEWGRRSQSEREELSAEINSAMRQEVDKAVGAGTFDVHPERFLVRFPLWVDQQGWEELHDALTLSLEECISIRERIRQRVGDGEASSNGFPVRVHLVSFEPAPREREA